MDTITIRGNAEIIATLPYTLGYHPTDSFVMLGLRDGRHVVTERNDLPEPGRDLPVAEVVRLLGPVLRTFRTHGVNQVVVLAFESSPGAARTMVGCAAEVAAHVGIRLVDCLLVRGQRWWNVDPTDVEPRPGDLGEPVPDPTRVPAVAELVALGHAPLADRDSLADLVSPRADVLARRVAGHLERRLTALPAGPRRAPTGAHVIALQRLLATGEEPVHPRDVATTAWALLDRDWRDGLIAWFCPGSLPLELLPVRVVNGIRRLPAPDAAEGRLRTPAGEAMRLAHRWLGWCRLVPDPAGECAASMLTVGGHLAWWAGDGALAREAVDRALRIDPTHRLAGLLLRLLDSGVRPGATAPRPGAVGLLSRGDLTG